MTKPIKVPVAFDNMTEESFNQLKRLLQDKKPKYLWFDETPYKQWLVKAANVQSFKWVCFDESHNGKEKRIYKGEGTLEFSCFSSYAESRVTFLDDLIDDVWFWNQEETPRKLIRERSGWYLKTIKTKNQNSETIFLNTTFDTSTSGTATKIYYKNKLQTPYVFIQQKWEELSIIVDNIQQSEGFILVPANLGFSTPTKGQGRIYYPGDLKTGSRTNLQAFIVNNEDALPLQINKDVYIEVFDMFNKNQKTYIALTNIFKQTQGGRAEYYYRTEIDPDNENTAQAYAVLFFQDQDDNLYWINPENGQPDFFTPVFCSYLQEVKKTNTLERYYNFEEWAESSRLKNREDYIEFNKYENQRVGVYNAGDIPTNIQLIYTSNPNKEMSLTLRSIYDDEKVVGQITLKKIDFIGEDNGFIIDSKLKLIKGTKNGTLTGTVYNKYIKSGDFFKIPICDDSEYYTITSSIDQEFSVEYKHYYI